jgi:hypothetical protein
VEESTVGLFKKLFFPLKSQFKKMDTLMQNRVALSITLAGFTQRAAENELLPKILSVVGTSISSEVKKKITTELAIGVIACVRIPDKTRLNDFWGLEVEALRQMVAMLVFSESSDTRQVLENATYSSNPDEARVQVLLAIVRLVGSKDDTLITRINTQAFGKEWNGFAAEFIDGAITGFKRSPRPAMIESVSGKLAALSPRGQALIEEFINRCATAPAKPQPDAAELLAPNSRAQILYNSARKMAEELRNLIRPMMGLPPMDLPQFQGIEQGMQIEWLRACIPYTANLLFISQIKKNIAFAKTNEFVVIYGQSVLHMASLEKEQAAHMGFMDKFEQKKAEASAQKDFREMEDAFLFYIDNFKKIPFPDTKFIDLLMAKIGVPETLRPQVSWKLREFNSKAQAEFSRL